MSTSARDIHYRYIIGILVAVLVGFVSVDWADVKDLGQLIAFALTFASAILAVIAIFQALGSQDSLGRVSATLTASADKVDTATSSIENATRKLIEHSEKVPSALGEMTSRLDRTEQLILNLSKPAQAETSLSAADLGVSQEASNKINEIFRYTTLGGDIAYYMCAKSFEKSRSFDPTAILEDGDGGRYVQGFLAGVRSSRFIEIELIDNTFSVKGLGPFKSPATILTKVASFVERLESPDKELLASELNKVTKFFDSGDPKDQLPKQPQSS